MHRGNTQRLGRILQPRTNCHVIFKFHQLSNHFQKSPGITPQIFLQHRPPSLRQVQAW